MDCVKLQALTKVPSDQLQAYIECMEAPSAGPPPEQTISTAQGLFVSAVIIALAFSQLFGATNLTWRRILLGVIAIGVAGLSYSAFRL